MRGLNRRFDAGLRNQSQGRRLLRSRWMRVIEASGVRARVSAENMAESHLVARPSTQLLSLGKRGAGLVTRSSRWASTSNRRTRRVRRLWSRSGRTLHPACRILGAVRGRDLEQSLKEDGRFIGSEVGGGGDIAFVNGCGHGRSSSGDRVKRCVSHISQQPVASAPSLHWRRDFRRGHG